jgi:hypothetical protein
VPPSSSPVQSPLSTGLSRRVATAAHLPRPRPYGLYPPYPRYPPLYPPRKPPRPLPRLNPGTLVRLDVTWVATVSLRANRPWSCHTLMSLPRNNELSMVNAVSTCSDSANSTYAYLGWRISKPHRQRRVVIPFRMSRELVAENRHPVYGTTGLKMSLDLLGCSAIIDLVLPRQNSGWKENSRYRHFQRRHFVSQ